MVNYVCNRMLGEHPTPQENQMVSDFFFPILAEMESMVMRDSYLGLISMHLVLLNNQ